jgi:hypothetical protein
VSSENAQGCVVSVPTRVAMIEAFTVPEAVAASLTVLHDHVTAVLPVIVAAVCPWTLTSGKIRVVGCEAV